MKKLVSLALVLAALISLTSCGAQKEEKPADSEAVQIVPVDYLQAIWGSYKDDEMFPIAGGDFDIANMENPDKFDVEKNKDAFMSTFLVSEDLLADINNDVASMQHMMNINTFCAAMFTVKDASRIQSFADDYNEIIQANEWMCGIPDTVVVLSVGNAMIIAYGEDGLIQTFKGKCEAAETSATVVLEKAVTL